MSWLTPAKEFFARAWNAIKKLPSWAVMAGLLLIAVCVYLFRLVLSANKKAQIQKERYVLETEKEALVQKARSIHREAGGEIEKKYEAKISVLDEEEKELDKEIAAGPVGIANAWKDYLSGVKE